MYTSRLKEDLDGRIHPPDTFESKEQAVQSAVNYTSRKQCEVEIIDPEGVLVGVWRDGEKMAA